MVYTRLARTNSCAEEIVGTPISDALGVAIWLFTTRRTSIHVFGSLAMPELSPRACSTVANSQVTPHEPKRYAPKAHLHQEQIAVSAQAFEFAINGDGVNMYLPGYLPVAHAIGAQSQDVWIEVGFLLPVGS